MGLSDAYVIQIITVKFEVGFKDHSYGFRPNRNAHQAVHQAQKNIHAGYDIFCKK